MTANSRNGHAKKISGSNRNVRDKLIGTAMRRKWKIITTQRRTVTNAFQF